VEIRSIIAKSAELIDASLSMLEAPIPAISCKEPPVAEKIAPEEWLTRAKQTRELAESVFDVKAKAVLFEIADTYEKHANGSAS
jgi:hypothetical protein